MRMAIGGDSVCHLIETITDHIEAKGIELVRCGALAGREADYVDSSREVAELVASGQCDQGLLFCNTGTGATIIANKVPGVRAALCVEAFAASVARLANNANVLVLSIFSTSEYHAREIVDVWLATGPSEEPRRVTFHRKTDELDAHYRKRPSER